MNKKTKFDLNISAQTIAKIAVNAIVIASEIRVVMTVYSLTGSMVTALLAMLGAGLPFILWYDLLHSNPLENWAQAALDWLFTGWAIIVGGVFVFADLALKVHINGVGVGIEALMSLLTVSTVANVFGLLAWLALDSEVQQRNQLAKLAAEEKFNARVMEIQKSSLAEADKTLAVYQELRKKYSPEALEAMGVTAPTLYGKSQRVGTTVQPANTNGSSQLRPRNLPTHPAPRQAQGTANAGRNQPPAPKAPSP